FLPPEYRELYQEKLADLRTSAPPMEWKKVKQVLEEEWEDPVEELFDDFEHDAGMILRLAKAIAPGLDAKAAAEELKERVLEELDYEYEAQNQRTFARAYRGHPFIYVPDVISRLTTERVLVTEWVDGLGFEDI